MSESPKSALHIAYNALMAIGALDEYYHSPSWCLERAKEIVGEALTELNTEHTAEVQKALGIGDE